MEEGGMEEMGRMGGMGGRLGGGSGAKASGGFLSIAPGHAAPSVRRVNRAADASAHHCVC